MNENQTDKSTILEAVVQFRFKNRLEIEDVFFTAKTVLHDFSYKKEPILELPVAVRETDPKLKYAAYYKFISDTLTVNISPSMISFSINGFYPGWSQFRAMIVEKYAQLKEITSQWETDIISIRYIDFFQNINIFNNISISVENPNNVCGNFFQEKRKNYVAEFTCKNSTEVKLQIVNNVSIPTEIDTSEQGSIIDTDVYTMNISNNEDALDRVHEVAKTTFFNILKDEFAEERNLKQ